MQTLLQRRHTNSCTGRYVTLVSEWARRRGDAVLLAAVASLRVCTHRAPKRTPYHTRERPLCEMRKPTPVVQSRQRPRGGPHHSSSRPQSETVLMHGVPARNCLEFSPQAQTTEHSDLVALPVCRLLGQRHPEPGQPARCHALCKGPTPSQALMTTCSSGKRRAKLHDVGYID